LENQYPDKAEYGQIADMEARPQGLAIKQILSEAGAALVRRGLRFISPHWLCNACGERNGIPVYEPVKMKSTGLTDKPNIPNKSLVNTAEAARTSMNKEKLIKLLGLANEATDEQIEQAIAAALARPTAEALANEKSSAVTATQRAQSAETELAKVKADLLTQSTALANAKAGKITELLTGAVKAGIITEADRPVWQKRLDRDFEGESVALVNSNPAIKTKPTAEALRLAELDAKLKKGASIGNEGDMPGESIGSLVNAEMATPACANIKNPGARYNAAFANVAKKYPKMFEPVIPAGT
jgi:hypothetical protein